nr:hypothetical protein [Tanacetum cinerariifolium]
MPTLSTISPMPMSLERPSLRTNLDVRMRVRRRL